MKSPASPWLRASLSYEQGLEEQGYYRNKTVVKKGNTVFIIWLVVILAILAITMSGHHQKEERIQLNKKEIMQRQEVSEAQHAMNQELWILREARNSSTMMDQFHAHHARRK